MTEQSAAFWKALLRVYIRRVLDREGTDFLSRRQGDITLATFTSDEWEELKIVRDEARSDMQ